MKEPDLDSGSIAILDAERMVGISPDWPGPFDAQLRVGGERERDAFGLLLLRASSVHSIPFLRYRMFRNDDALHTAVVAVLDEVT